LRPVHQTATQLLFLFGIEQRLDLLLSVLTGCDPELIAA